MPARNTTLPSTHALLTVYLHDHEGIWDLEGPAIGLPASQTADVTRVSNTLDAALADLSRIRMQEKAAVKVANAAGADARKVTNGAIATIRAYANASPDPVAIYNTAKVPPRAKATPTPAPLAPRDVRITLQPGGSVQVTWEGSTSQTFFVLRRKLTDAAGATGSWRTMEHDGAKPFVDGTIPAGTTVVTYAIRGIRNHKTSPWSEEAGLPFVPGHLEAANLRLAA